MKKIDRMCGTLIGLLLVFAIWWYINNFSADMKEAGMVINEICDNNFSTAPLDMRENVDWIELYNASEETISLDGWMISDDTEEVNKFVLPDVEVSAGEWVLLYATGENSIEGDTIFLNFKLSDNEILLLSDPEGKTVDSVLIPELKQNTSYARRMDASEEWCNSNPSPLLSNSEAAPLQTVEVAEPVFSLPSGFYTGRNVLELSTEGNSLDIYYTLDGSEPTQESYYYCEPIIIEDRSYFTNVLSARADISSDYCYRFVPEGLVDKITVIRAIAIDQEGNKSDIVTNSYIVDIQNKDTYQDLAIVSLTVEPDELFNFENGLYVLGSEYVMYMEQGGEEAGLEEPQENYSISGRLSERAAYIEIFDDKQRSVLNQDVGIRIRGNTTRKLSQKSFSIFAREMYSGTDAFTQDIFGNDETYSKLRLLTDRDVTKLRHELHAQLLKDRDVTTQDYIRCNVFLNGEYWGVYSLVQSYDGQYIENKYEVPEDKVIINENLMPVELKQIVDNEAGLSEEEVYEKLVSRIDLESYIDYFASMIFIDHHDWLHHNGYMWKSSDISSDNPYHDGRWRWMIYDTESCENDFDANTFRTGLVSAWHDDPIAKALMTNAEFREQFVVTFMDLANTVFEKEHVLEQINSIFSNYEQAVESQGIRWGDDWADEVYEELDEIKEFYTKRFDFITGCLKEEFALSGGLEPLHLTISGNGSVQVNSVIPEFENNGWEGYYFSDYPIQLHANADEGAAFEGWYDGSGNLISKEVMLEVTLDGANEYIAEFK